MKKYIYIAKYETPYFETIAGIKNDSKLSQNEAIIFYIDQANLKKQIFEINSILSLMQSVNEVLPNCCSLHLNEYFEAFSIHTLKACEALIVCNSNIWEYMINILNLQQNNNTFENEKLIFEIVPTCRNCPSALKEKEDIEFIKKTLENVISKSKNEIEKIQCRNIEQKDIGMYDTYGLSGLYKSSRMLDSLTQLLNLNSEQNIKIIFSLIGYWIVLVFEILHMGKDSSLPNVFARFSEQNIIDKQNNLEALINELANYVYQDKKSFFYINRTELGLVHPSSKEDIWNIHDENNPIIQSFIFCDFTKQQALDYINNLNKIIKTLISCLFVSHWKVVNKLDKQEELEKIIDSLYK